MGLRAARPVFTHLVQTFDPKNAETPPEWRILGGDRWQDRLQRLADSEASPDFRAYANRAHLAGILGRAIVELLAPTMGSMLGHLGLKMRYDTASYGHHGPCYGFLRPRWGHVVRTPRPKTATKHGKTQYFLPLSASMPRLPMLRLVEAILGALEALLAKLGQLTCLVILDRIGGPPIDLMAASRLRHAAHNNA